MTKDELVIALTRKFDRAKEDVDGWTARFQDDPLRAISSARTYIQGGTEMRVYRDILVALTKSNVTVEFMMTYVQNRMRLLAMSNTSSTNPVHDMVERQELACLARIADFETA